MAALKRYQLNFFVLLEDEGSHGRALQENLEQGQLIKDSHNVYET